MIKLLELLLAQYAHITQTADRMFLTAMPRMEHELRAMKVVDPDLPLDWEAFKRISQRQKESIIHKWSIIP